MQQANDTLSLILPIPTDINELYILNDTFTSPSISTIINKNSSSYWAFSLIIFPILTIFGNILVVISVYREKSLHTITNYFVVSLAIADITVASIVMPFAIYLEFNKVWELSDRLCDFWVASDCMACTASILNLVAIAVDRYIAVTKPLKYARHKNPRRVSIMIVVVWLISFFIALPIVSGVNKSDVEPFSRFKGNCSFFNNKFLIFSSLGSFFIPCIIIFAIYYRIFMVIMARAQKNRKYLRPKAAIELAAKQHRTTANDLLLQLFRDRRPKGTATVTEPIVVNNTLDDNTYKTPMPPLATTIHNADHLTLKLTAPVLPSIVAGSLNITSSSGDIPDDERDDIALFLHHNGSFDNDIITKPSSSIQEQQQKHTASQTEQNHNNRRLKTRLKNKDEIITTTAITSVLEITPTNNASSIVKNNKDIAKAAKRKAHSHQKKERKATKTLVIVLICFLVCWLPFFVLNNLVNAICRISKNDSCMISDFIITFCAWLGWINSTLNPIIYTIFNLEFRKAFAKILFSSCT